MSAFLRQAVLGFRFPCSDFNVPYSASAGSTRRGPTERTCGARVDSARPRRPSRFFGLTSGKSSARRQRTRCKPYASNMTRGDWRDVRFGVEAFRTRPIGLRAHRHVDVHKLERAWAAGFLDAEGCFGLAHSHARKRGPAWYRVRASVSQHGEVADHQRPCSDSSAFWESAISSGTVTRMISSGLAEGDEKVQPVVGATAEFVGADKLVDAHQALRRFRTQTRLKGGATHCVRGHPYGPKVMRGGRTKHVCGACARLLDRMSRARRGLRPRRFKNIARRYTF